MIGIWYGNYIVMPHGEVISLKTNNGLFKIPVTSRSGRVYWKVAIYEGGKRDLWFIHRLVAHLYLGPSRGRQVNHKDRDTGNNHHLNLEYVSASKNQRHWRQN